MNLYHYGPATLALDRARTYTQRTGDTKPSGLWVSAEDSEDNGWKHWCEQEDFCLGRLTHRAEVLLKPDANLVHLATAEDIDAFTRQFRLPIMRDLYGIDWPTVAEQYAGILIAPYQWSRRNSLDTFWYYGWDCASGCVWDLAAVREVIHDTH